MFYLCPRHRKELAFQPSAQLEDLWLSCLNQASLYYDLQLMREALPLIGCAFELAEIRLWQSHRPEQADVLQMTLSTLYLINTCRHLGETERASSAHLRCESNLDAFLEDSDLGHWASHCRWVLANPCQHQAFFRHYLNYPYDPEPANTTLH